jgi:hypothetical protein
MDELYDINFKSNNKFCKIHIHYNIIYELSTMHHLNHSFMSDKTIWNIFFLLKK